MIPAPQQVWPVVEPVDMRAGSDRLSQQIQNTLGRSPCDGTGVWPCQRRLHQGHFTWPAANTPVSTLTAAQWQWLITGVDWRRLNAVPPANWQV